MPPRDPPFTAPLLEHTPRPPTLSDLRALIALGRLKFLPYSAVLFGLGATIALYRGRSIALGPYVHGQLFVWCVHLMTHYCNEYFDLEADRENRAPTPMTGGSRVLVDGLLSPTVSLRAAVVLLLAALALLAGMPFGACVLGGGMIALAWFYTAPPLRLNYRGLGEITVSVVLNVLTPLLGYRLQAGSLDRGLVMMILPAAVLQVVRMMIMNLMDYAGDTVAGKRTLPTLLGRRNVKYVYLLGQVAAYGLALLFVGMGLPRLVLLLLALTSPLPLWLSVRLWRDEDRDVVKAGRIAFWASSHVALAVAAVSFGLVGETLRTTLGARDGSWLLCAAIPALFVGRLAQMVRESLRSPAPPR